MLQPLLWHSVQKWSKFDITPLEDWSMFQPRSRRDAPVSIQTS